MTIKSFAELTKHVHLLNDLILSDMICGSVDYSEEFLTFSRHLFATKYWFVRISWANKRRYLLALVEDVRSAWTLSLLLKSLWNCRPKDAVLSANQHRPWSVYDQAPLDHNRTALPVTTLGQVMTNDRKWFHLLDSESQALVLRKLLTIAGGLVMKEVLHRGLMIFEHHREKMLCNLQESQALVLCELLTIAGGPVMWEVLHRGQKIFQHHSEQTLRSLLDCIVVEQTPLPKDKLEQSEASSKQSSPTTKSEKQKPVQDKTDVLSMLPSEPTMLGKDNDYNESILPPSPVAEDMIRAQRNLEASLFAWNQIIKGIRDHQKLEELEMTFKDGTKRTIWKVNRVTPDTVETVDFIQLLPSAIAKQILLYLPRSNFPDYAKVNRYWAYLVDELKVEFTNRAKLDIDRMKLEEIMLKHDVSLEVFQPSGIITLRGSIANSVDPSSRRVLPSYRPSERSTGGVSFRHMVVEKLKPKQVIKPKPIRNLRDLDARLEQRGAADENLWEWCGNVRKMWKRKHPEMQKKPEEGVLWCGDMHFPCPLMKHSVLLPLTEPMDHDPAQPSADLPKMKRNFSYAPVNMTKDTDLKRFSLWSRDFSSLYKVFKVASYQYPT